MPRISFLRAAACFALITAASLVARSAWAAADTWTGATNAMGTGTNWTGTNTPPTSGDSWVFGTAGAGGLDLNNNLTTTGTSWNVAGISPLDAVRLRHS